MYYRTEPIVCLNILKATLQCTGVKPMQYFVSVVKEKTQAEAIALHKVWSLFIF